jgi:hypothetical protein
MKFTMGYWRGQLTIKNLVKISLRDYEKIGSKIIKQHLQLEGFEQTEPACCAGYER